MLSTRLLLPAVIAGTVMAGILAATISSSDSYLLIAASAFSKNIYRGHTEKRIRRPTNRLWRCPVLRCFVIAAVGHRHRTGMKTASSFTIVSFAWAGFGATFGPLMLFSLFWKRTTRAGAIAGMVSGGATVFIWKLLLNPLGGIFGIYELLPAFLLSSIVIVVVSLLTKEPSEEIEREFEQAKAQAKAS